MQKVHGCAYLYIATTDCKRLVSVLFHSPLGVLFTFPSRYSFTIGHQLVFSFTQWSGLIPTEFHVLHGTWDIIYIFFYGISRTGLSPSLVALSRAFNYRIKTDLKMVFFRNTCPTSLLLQRIPPYTARVFSCSRFAHHYSGNHIRFLFLALLRCFSSSRYLPYPIYSGRDA